jgi:NADPH-dependent 2,4-dienoyl-CoA reductase/sulfur reductase-like enzyme
MNSDRKLFDVVVVGAGPAGVAAAATAAECGARVLIIDDNPAPGGQIWRGEAANGLGEPASWLTKLHHQNIQLLSGTRVFDHPAAHVLHAETADGFLELGYQKLILATGARERFLPFPGWTLPNVMGAGGLQALVKSGLPMEGKRVVVAGTGPLLLAVASYLRKHGAEIRVICEQASRASLARFGLALLSQPQKITQGLALRRHLSGVPFVTESWPMAACGDGVVKEVLIRRGRGTEKIACDYLACGFHLVPNTELPALVGCRLRDDYVEVDDLERTSVPDVFCAGEPTGIGGVELALVEGQIAGATAAGRPEVAQKHARARTKLERFARALDRAFALRPELQNVPLPETIVCRCEDITYARLKPYGSWRSAKLETRCGMGPCQGRVCGPATQFLFHWSPDSVRPPVFPTVLRNLAAMSSKEAQHSGAMRGSQ